MMNQLDMELGKSFVGIIGLGLMGGSLALALRGKCAGILGLDNDPGTLNLARELNLANELSDKLDFIKKADLIILATPVLTIINLLHELPKYHPDPAVVMDLGSTKGLITAAMQEMPDRFDPIGGHPMCGKEHSTLKNADAKIFQEAAFALTPLPRTSTLAKILAEQVVQAIGSIPVWLEPQPHDRLVAATSHIPFVLSNTLAAITPLEARPMIGSGFRSTARLAPTPLHMMQDVLITNRDNILGGLAEYRAQLSAIETALSEGDYSLVAQLLDHGANQYKRLFEIKEG